MNMTIFILTTAYNLYDQQGDYFVKAFAAKPSAEELKAAMSSEAIEHINDKVVDNLLTKGGGRMNREDQWWYLDEITI